MKELADRLPPRIGKIIKIAVEIKLTLCAIFALILPVTFFFVVVFRYGFQADLFAYEEWLLPISFWLYFLGSAVGSYEGSQIRADVMESLFKTPEAIWWRKVVLNIIELAIGLVIFYWAFLMISNEIAKYPNWQTTIALGIPHFVPRLGIFVGISFMVFYEMLHLFVLIKFGPALIKEDMKDDALLADCKNIEGK